MGLLLIALGLLPFALGGLMNWYMLAHLNSLPPFFAITLLALLLWGGIAFLGRYKLDTWRVVLSLNTAAFAVLLLLAIQELCFHAYWMNPAGAWTQLFFLPLMNVSYFLTSWSQSLFPTHCAAFILMLVASLLGCKTAETYLTRR